MFWETIIPQRESIPTFHEVCIKNSQDSLHNTIPEDTNEMFDP